MEKAPGKALSLRPSGGLLQSPFPSHYRLSLRTDSGQSLSLTLKPPPNPFSSKRSSTSSEQGPGLCYFCPFWDFSENRFLFSVCFRCETFPVASHPVAVGWVSASSLPSSSSQAPPASPSIPPPRKVLSGRSVTQFCRDLEEEVRGPRGRHSPQGPQGPGGAY